MSWRSGRVQKSAAAILSARPAFRSSHCDETSVRAIYELMGKLTGFREPPRHQPARTGEVARSAIDPGKAEIHLGWKPFTPLEEGLARTLEHVKAMREGLR